jgi:hypothetical protein
MYHTIILLALYLQTTTFHDFHLTGGTRWQKKRLDMSLKQICFVSVLFSDDKDEPADPNIIWRSRTTKPQTWSQTGN